MDRNTLKNVIFDQHETIKKQVIHKRNYTLEDNINYILVGIRRSGKSTILYSKVLELISRGISWNRIIYINFEDERLLGFNVSDFQDILLLKNELTEEKAYYFFDEIQNIDHWEKFARRMADSNEQVCITGSNSKMLSTEMNAALGGRYITKFIMPYSFTEYLNANFFTPDDSTSSLGLLQKHTSDYLKNGGLPASLNFSDKREYIQSVYQKLLFNDIIIHNGVRNENALKLLVKKLAETVKDEMSFTKLHNTLKSIGFSISKDTIIDYVNYIKNSNLIFEVKNFYASFVDKESTPKYYFMDNGILNLFLVDKNTRLLENAVAVKLLRNSEDFYYLKSNKTGLDVDFYIPDKDTLIQAAYSVLDYDTENREVTNLLKWDNNESNLIIVTYDEKKEITKDGKKISVIPVKDFLLNY